MAVNFKKLNDPFLRGLVNFSKPYHMCRESCKEIDTYLKHLIKAIFFALKKGSTFPKRYLGAKTWSLPGLAFRIPKNFFNQIVHHKRTPFSQCLGSGYHYRMQGQLSSKDIIPYIRYCSATAAVHTSDSSWVEPFGLKALTPNQLKLNLETIPGTLSEKRNCYFDKNTGLKIMITSSNDEVFVAFGAMDSSHSELGSKCENDQLKRKTYQVAFQNLIGLKPFIYEQADAFFKVLKNHPSVIGKKITLCGQCYGGSLASYVALKNKEKAYCFNTFQLGVGLQENIGKDILNEADRYVTHVSAKGDFISNLGVISILDHIISLIGIKTPGNFGKRYQIPTAYRDCLKTHNFMLGSMMKHAGYSTRTKPQDVFNNKD